ncbi:hypothetical protein PSPO01_05694 [Paraphaeosphaeria sporulosa]
MLIECIIAAVVALLPITLAAPTNITGALAVSSSLMHLEARDRICIDCKNLCEHTRNLHEAYACTAVCHKRPGHESLHVHLDKVIDEHECLNSKERKNLALNLFRDQAEYINMMGKHEIKSFLRSHLDSYILHGADHSVYSASERIDAEFESFPSPPPGDGIRIDCGVMCNDTKTKSCADKHGLGAEYINYEGACANICPYRPDNQQHCIKTLNNDHVLALFLDFDPLNYKWKYSDCMEKKGEERKKCFEKVIFGECPHFRAQEYLGAKYCR